MKYWLMKPDRRVSIDDSESTAKKRRTVVERRSRN
jgi:hypothetical protein